MNHAMAMVNSVEPLIGDRWVTHIVVYINISNKFHINTCPYILVHICEEYFVQIIYEGYQK